jgi:hypothetical protein
MSRVASKKSTDGIIVPPENLITSIEQLDALVSEPETPARRTRKPPGSITVTPPKIHELHVTLEGDAPLVIQRFSEKQRQVVQEGQMAGSTKRGKKVREPKDFEALYEAAKYISLPDANGVSFLGMAAAAFRSSMISACRTVDFPMVRAKLALFIKPDGFDKFDRTPLVRIYGEPHMWVGPVRNASGVIDLRSRPMWDPPWFIKLVVLYDSEMFTNTDVANLLARAGVQVGVGEGRHDSKQSNGMGFGLWHLQPEIGEVQGA